MIEWAGSTNIQEVLLNLISIKYLETKSEDTILKALGPTHIYGCILGEIILAGRYQAIFWIKKSNRILLGGGVGGLYSTGQQVLPRYFQSK